MSSISYGLTPAEAENLLPANGIVGDYYYRYSEAMQGWYVNAVDTTKTSYGAVPSSYSNVPVVGMEECYKGCTNAVALPQLPDKVIDIENCFRDCTSLSGDYVIPRTVTTYNNAFKNANVARAVIASSNGTIVEYLDTAIYSSTDELNALFDYDAKTASSSGDAILADSGTTVEDTTGPVFNMASVLRSIASSSFIIDASYSDAESAVVSVQWSFDGKTWNSMADCVQPAGDSDIYLRGTNSVGLKTDVNIGPIYGNILSIATEPAISAKDGTVYAEYNGAGWEINIGGSTYTAFTKTQELNLDSTTIFKSSQNGVNIYIVCANLYESVVEVQSVLSTSLMSLGASLQSATTVTVGSYIYTLEDGGWSVSLSSAASYPYTEITSPYDGYDVVSVNGLFADDLEIKIAPVIPSTVTNVGNLFANCVALEGAVEYYGTPTVYEGAFVSAGRDTEKGIALKCNASVLSSLIGTKGDGKVRAFDTTAPVVSAPTYVGVIENGSVSTYAELTATDSQSGIKAITYAVNNGVSKTYTERVKVSNGDKIVITAENTDGVKGSNVGIVKALATTPPVFPTETIEYSLIEGIKRAVISYDVPSSAKLYYSIDADDFVEVTEKVYCNNNVKITLKYVSTTGTYIKSKIITYDTSNPDAPSIRKTYYSSAKKYTVTITLPTTASSVAKLMYRLGNSASWVTASNSPITITSTGGIEIGAKTSDGYDSSIATLDLPTVDTTAPNTLSIKTRLKTRSGSKRMQVGIYAKDSDSDIDYIEYKVVKTSDADDDDNDDSDWDWDDNDDDDDDDDDWDKYDDLFYVRNGYTVVARAYNDFGLYKTVSKDIEYYALAPLTPILTSTHEQDTNKYTVTLTRKLGSNEDSEDSDSIVYKLADGSWVTYSTPFSALGGVLISYKVRACLDSTVGTTTLDFIDVNPPTKPTMTSESYKEGSDGMVRVTVKATSTKTSYCEYSTNGTDYQRYTVPFSCTTDANVYARAVGLNGKMSEVTTLTTRYIAPELKVPVITITDNGDGTGAVDISKTDTSTEGDIMYKTSDPVNGSEWAYFNSQLSFDRGITVYAKVTSGNSESKEVNSVVNVAPKFVPAESRTSMVFGISQLDGSVQLLVPAIFDVSIKVNGEAKEGTSTNTGINIYSSVLVSDADKLSYELSLKGE